MVAKAAWVAGRGTFTLDNPKDPYDPTMGAITHHNGTPESSHIVSEKDQRVLNANDLSSGRAAKEHVTVENFMNVVSMANTAQVERSAEGSWSVKGDPTEIALQVFASRFNWNRKRLVDETNQWKLVAEYPFDSDVKRMSVIYSRKTDAGEEESWVFSKGAVERLLPLCTHIQCSDGDSVTQMGPEWNTAIMKNVDYLANQGLRVLCLASAARIGMQKGGNVEDLKREDIEQGLTFRGLVGIYDPPRPESAGAVAACKKAHITVHMLTGDHPGTAAAIAKQVGIIPFNPQPSLVMTASEFDKLSDDQVDALRSLPRVIARCTPQTKVRMIDALHRRKRFAAMTGDGVNDSPSLVRADVGIAMVCFSTSDVLFRIGTLFFPVDHPNHPLRQRLLLTSFCRAKLAVMLPRTLRILSLRMTTLPRY
jgi:P-type Na+/K+ transporter